METEYLSLVFGFNIHGRGKKPERAYIKNLPSRIYNVALQYVYFFSLHDLIKMEGEKKN